MNSTKLLVARALVAAPPGSQTRHLFMFVVRVAIAAPVPQPDVPPHNHIVSGRHDEGVLVDPGDKKVCVSAQPNLYLEPELPR